MFNLQILTVLYFIHFILLKLKITIVYVNIFLLNEMCSMEWGSSWSWFCVNLYILHGMGVIVVLVSCESMHSS